MTKYKTVNTTLEPRHIKLIDQHAAEHNLGGNRSLALRQILDNYAGLKSMVKVQGNLFGSTEKKEIIPS